MRRQPEEGHTDYPMDTERVDEMVRITRQARIYTNISGGVLTWMGEEEQARLHSILDLACGPGEWIFRVAERFPNAAITGIDISRAMIEYAQAQAQDFGYSNITFLRGDIRNPLPFPDSSFDLANARLIIGVMPGAMWPALYREVYRVLTRDGIIQLTEPEAPAVPEGSTFYRVMLRLNQALYNMGMSFCAQGISQGAPGVIPSLLGDAGFSHITRHSGTLDVSYGQPYHALATEDMLETFRLMRPFYKTSIGMSEEEHSALYEELRAEMNRPDFTCIGNIVSTQGRKREDS